MRLIFIVTALFGAIGSIAMISVENEIIEAYNVLVNQTDLPKVAPGTIEAQNILNTLIGFVEEQDRKKALSETHALLQRFENRFNTVYKVIEALPYLKNQESLSVLLGFRARGLISIDHGFEFDDGALFKKCITHYIPQCKTFFSDEALFDGHVPHEIKSDVAQLRAWGIDLKFTWEKFLEQDELAKLSLAFTCYVKYELTITDTSIYHADYNTGKALGYDAVNIVLFGSPLERSLEKVWDDSYFGDDLKLGWIVYDSTPAKESANKKFKGYQLLFEIAKAKWKAKL